MPDKFGFHRETSFRRGKLQKDYRSVEITGNLENG
jgi:hypothetical protein